MFCMDNDTKQVKRPVSIWRRLTPWIGGMLLFAIGQHLYYERIDGPYSYQVLLFEERGRSEPDPSFRVSINDKVAFETIALTIPEGPFERVTFRGPVRSRHKDFTVTLTPLRQNGLFPTYTFEIVGDDKERFCDLVFEIRNHVPIVIGCTGRAYGD